MVYQFHDLVLDVGRRSLSRDGEPIKLTKLTFNLLQTLVEAAPDLVQTDDLIDRVWGPGRVVSPENVSQRVMMLRQSLGDNANDPVYIEGIRGQGLRLLPAVKVVTEERDNSSETTTEQEKADKPAVRSSLWLLLLLSGFALLWWYSEQGGYSRKTAEPLVPGASSIAVLPFTNMSPNPDNSFYAAGIHEEVLNQLAKLTSLRVISRTSMLRYENTRQSIPEIAKELEVDTLVEGSVRYAKNRIRVTVQLVDGARDEHLWSETYDRELEDIFSIESDIASEVAAVLQQLVSEEQAELLRKPPTNNVEAYAQYMRGRELLVKRDPKELEQAVTHFRAAVEIDEDYALGWVGLFDALKLYADYARVDSDDLRAEQKSAVRKALDLDATLGEAWLAQAVLTRKAGDFEKAEKQYLKAIDLNPGYSQTYHWYGMFLLREQWRPEEALVQFRKAASLDPLGPAVNSMVAETLWILGRVEESEALLRKQIQSNPDYPFYRTKLSEQLGFMGQLDASLYWAVAGAKLDPWNLFARLLECRALLNLGDDNKAERCRQRMVVDFPEEQFLQYWGRLLAFRGEHDALLEQVKMFPPEVDESWARWELGFAYLNVGNVDKAKEILAGMLPRYFGDTEFPIPPTELDRAVFTGIILSFASEPNMQRANYLFDSALDTMKAMHRIRPIGFGAWDAVIHVARNDREKACAALREAIDSGWRQEWHMLRGRMFEPIGQEPCWQALYSELEADVNRQYSNYKANKNNPDYW